MTRRYLAFWSMIFTTCLIDGQDEPSEVQFVQMTYPANPESYSVDFAIAREFFVNNRSLKYIDMFKMFDSKEAAVKTLKYCCLLAASDGIEPKEKNLLELFPKFVDGTV